MATSRANNGRSCIFCNGSHSCHLCPAYPTMIARKQRLKDKKLCHLCLQKLDQTCPSCLFCKQSEPHGANTHSLAFCTKREKQGVVNIQHRPPRRGNCLFCDGPHYDDMCTKYPTVLARKQCLSGRNVCLNCFQGVDKRPVGCTFCKDEGRNAMAETHISALCQHTFGVAPNQSSTKPPTKEMSAPKLPAKGVEPNKAQEKVKSTREMAAMDRVEYKVPAKETMASRVPALGNKNTPGHLCVFCSGPHADHLCKAYKTVAARQVRLKSLRRCIYCLRKTENIPPCYYCENAERVRSMRSHPTELCPEKTETDIQRAKNRPSNEQHCEFCKLPHYEEVCWKYPERALSKYFEGAFLLRDPVGKICFFCGAREHHSGECNNVRTLFDRTLHYFNQDLCIGCLQKGAAFCFICNDDGRDYDRRTHVAAVCPFAERMCSAK